MNRARLVAALTCLAFSWSAATATDLSKIDRNIKKEPAYKGKPRYCLLVFGPEAKTLVWVVADVVQDRDVGASIHRLYIDGNGTGVVKASAGAVQESGGSNSVPAARPRIFANSARRSS